MQQSIVPLLPLACGVVCLEEVRRLAQASRRRRVC